MCSVPGQSQGNMSNGLFRDVVGATLGRQPTDLAALGARAKAEAGGSSGVSRRAPAVDASRPVTATILGSGGGNDPRRAAAGLSPATNKTLLGQ